MDRPHITNVDVCHQLHPRPLQGLAIPDSTLPGPVPSTPLQFSASIEAPAGWSDQRAATGREILVAEDSEANQIILRKQLALLGFVAHMSRNGLEALERLRSRDYDLLLTDLQMPRMDGYELARAVRASETGSRRMPIVALTGNGFVDDANRCLDVGMDGCLIKPVRLAALKAMLWTVLPDALLSTASPDDPGSGQAR